MGVQDCAFPLSSLEITGTSGDDGDPCMDTEPRLRNRQNATSTIYSCCARWIANPGDLPLRLNQWKTAFRSEPCPQPFLRCRELLIQEAHTAHMTQYEAHEEMLQVLDIYTAVYEELLAVPLIRGLQSDPNSSDEVHTAVLFGLVPALEQCIQAGACHELGQQMSKEYNITTSDVPVGSQTVSNSTVHVWQNSWNLSIRAIGLMVATHGDNRGLVLPPHIAETQVVIIPHQDSRNKNDHHKIRAEILSIQSTLASLGVRVSADLRDWRSTGWKMKEWITRGAPIRLVFGSEELAGRYVTICQRDLPKPNEEITIPLSQLPTAIPTLLAAMHNRLFKKAQDTIRSRQRQLADWDEFVKTICNRKTAYICLVPHCLTKDCQRRIESRLKFAIESNPDSETSSMAASVNFLCIPWDQPSGVGEKDASKCIYPECIRNAKKWAMVGCNF